MTQKKYDLKKDERYLRLLAKSFPNIADAATEIINLEAIAHLPKGTEHFLADIHGEYQAFQHVLKNASGNIKRKVNELFGERLRNIEKLESMRDSKGTKLKLGIMGGTFNPIHNAHLATAEFIRDKYDLDKVIFIPAGDPPHKKGVLNKFKRFDMVILSTLKNDDFLVSDYEVLSDKERDYTVDTLRHISETYPNEELYFITGSDALNQMETWKEFQENFKLAKFVAAIRPGINLLETQENVEAFRQRYDADIDMVYVPSLEISSTYIRSLVKNGKSIKYLVPSRVEEYINVHNLYGGVVR